MPHPDAAAVAAADSAAAYACATCGGHGAWHAATQQVVCRFCGKSLELPAPQATAVTDFAFIALLRDRPDSGRDWQPVPTEVRCTTCLAVTTYDAQVVGRRCEACGAPTLVPCDATGAPVTPGSVLPFRIAPGDAETKMREWLAGKSAIRRGGRATLEPVRAVYLPCWTFSAQFECRWRGEYVRRKDNEEQRIPVDGIVERQFVDVTVPATRTVDEPLWRGVEPFPINELVPFDSRYLAGSEVQAYAVNLWDAWDAAQARMQSEADAELKSATRKVAQIEQWPRWFAERCKHVLVPLYVATYRQGDTTYQVVMNGCTGTVAGSRPRDVLMEIIVLLVFLGVAAGIVSLAVWAVRALVS